MLLVDTNVLVDVLQNDPQWADWSIAQMRAQASLHALVINPMIDAEVSLSFSTIDARRQPIQNLLSHARSIGALRTALGQSAGHQQPHGPSLPGYPGANVCQRRGSPRRLSTPVPHAAHVSVVYDPANAASGTPCRASWPRGRRLLAVATPQRTACPLGPAPPCTKRQVTPNAILMDTSRCRAGARSGGRAFSTINPANAGHLGGDRCPTG